MARLSSTPSSQTVLELEARKSFAFSVELVDAAGAAIDMSGSTLTFSMGSLIRAGAPLLELEALNGNFYFQAVDLDLPASTYGFVVTLRTNGYSFVLLKGEVRLLANVELGAVSHTYTVAEPTETLSVMLQKQQVVRVETRGQVVNVGGGLSAEAAALNTIPLALGDNTWEWRMIDWRLIQEKPAEFPPEAHNHDSAYSPLGHNHDSAYSPLGHNHDSAYSPLGHNHDAAYSPLGHNHDERYFTETEVSALIAAAVPTGTIHEFAGGTAPSGWLLCDGAAVSRTTYAALFAVCGTAFGSGDNSTTFNIPNLKGRVPVGLDSGQTEFNVRGKTGGAKTHTLTMAQIPNATGSFVFHGQESGGPVWKASGVFGGSSLDSNRYKTLPNAGAGSASNPTINFSLGGGGGAHNNLQPYIALNFIIKT